MKAINPANLPSRERYKLLTGAIVPRAIAWVSSVDTDGNANLAPYSFFTAVTSNPPTVIFCPSANKSDGNPKDSLSNIRATGEFVVNFVTAALGEAMVQTAVESLPDLDEFQRAGVTPIDSTIVNVPRVGESPIHFECKLSQIIPIGDGHIVAGEVVYMHFDDAIHSDNNYINIAAYQPIGRLAGSSYTYVHDLFEMHRPPSELKKD